MNVAKILIVEDERNIAYTLAQTLRRMSNGEFVVDICYSATEALELMASKQIDLVISDLRLPGMSGLEMISKIRQTYPAVQTILMTGFGSAEVEAAADKLTTAYLPKPFNLPDVLNLVRSRLKSGPNTGAVRVLKVETGLSQIARRIDQLRVDVSAPYAMLVDLNGYTLLDSGNPGSIDQTALNALLCNSMAASNELVHMLKERQSLDLHYHDGDQFQIYTVKVNENTLLSLLFYGTSTRIGSVWLYLKRTAEGLRDQLAAEKASQPAATAPKQSKAALADNFSASLERALDETLFGGGSTPIPAALMMNVPANDEILPIEEAIRRGLLKNVDLGNKDQSQ